MTLVFFDGFDNAALMPKPEWDVLQSWQGWAGRDGVTNSAAGVPNGSSTKFLSLTVAPATITFGFALFVNATNMFGNVSAPLWTIRNSALANLVSTTQDATGKLQVRNGGPSGTVVATSAQAIAVSTWHHMQVKVTPSTTGTGSIEVRLNGTTIISFAGANSPSTGGITQIGFGSANGGSNWLLDDLWVCDPVDATATQGRANNDFLGDLKVATVVPTGAGSSTQWTPNTAVANWTTVDENPANQTDYNTAATTGLRDLYAAADLPSTATGVYALRVGLYAQKTDAGAAFVRPAIKEPGGTVNLSAALGLTTTYSGFWGDVLTAKGAGGAWSVADVNGAEIGMDSA